jgi:hypothetical protein
MTRMKGTKGPRSALFFLFVRSSFLGLIFRHFVLTETTLPVFVSTCTSLMSRVLGFAMSRDQISAPCSRSNSPDDTLPSGTFDKAIRSASLLVILASFANCSHSAQRRCGIETDATHFRKLLRLAVKRHSNQTQGVGQMCSAAGEVRTMDKKASAMSAISN